MQLSEIKLTPLLDTLQLVKISDSEYFSPKYGEYISNSRLGFLIQDKVVLQNRFLQDLKMRVSFLV